MMQTDRILDLSGQTQNRAETENIVRIVPIF